MAKRSGLGQGLWISGVDCSGDTGEWTGNGPTAMDNVTGVDKSAMERLPLQRDGQMGIKQFFNPTAGSAFQTVRANAFSQILNYDLAAICSSTIGDHAIAGRFRQASHTLTREQSGRFTFDTQWPGNGYGVEWGRLLTAGKRTDTGATSPATGVDFTDVTTLFGWQAWLHVFAFTGTSVTVTLQDSADNAAFANLTGGAFAAATTVGSQRIEGGRTATVRRYVRAITTGTFSNAVFGVIFNRNLTATAF